jgi:hypothetical protein
MQRRGVVVVGGVDDCPVLKEMLRNIGVAKMGSHVKSLDDGTV